MLDRQLVVDALPSYEILGELGRGGSGIVLEGRHRDLGRAVAIKQLPRAFAADPEVRARFLVEAKTVASLDHPHIIPVFDFVEREGLCLLVMELLPGGSVWDIVKRDGLTPEQALVYVIAASVGTHAAHQQGVLHRDIKPENILVSAQGVPKLADFGLVKVLGAGTLAVKTEMGIVLGTPAYLAPEQVTGDGVSPATDVFALATLAYELLSGVLPFAEEESAVQQLMRRLDTDPIPFAQVRPAEVPEALTDVIMAGLSRAPADRPQTAETLAIELAKAATPGFGAGWLQRTGIPLLGAPSVVMATEQGPQVAPTRRPTQAIRVTSIHLSIDPTELAEEHSVARPDTSTVMIAAPEATQAVRVPPSISPVESRPPTLETIAIPAPPTAPSAPIPPSPAGPAPKPAPEPEDQELITPVVPAGTSGGRASGGTDGAQLADVVGMAAVHPESPSTVSPAPVAAPTPTVAEHWDAPTMATSGRKQPTVAYISLGVALVVILLLAVAFVL